MVPMLVWIMQFLLEITLPRKMFYNNKLINLNQLPITRHKIQMIQLSQQQRTDAGNEEFRDTSTNADFNVNKPKESTDC